MLLLNQHLFENPLVSKRQKGFNARVIGRPKSGRRTISLLISHSTDFLHIKMIAKKNKIDSFT